MKVLIVIPTYNEKENVIKIIDAIFKVNSHYQILFVDDNSPDKTWQIVKKMAKKNRHIHLIRREFKEGIGPAYLAGFSWALKKKFDFIFQMDGDLSHDPKVIPKMIELAHHSGWAIGSRYTEGGNIKGWDFKRTVISWLGNFYTKIFLGFQIKDWTSGFCCWKKEVLSRIDLNFGENPNGYAFQIAIKYKALLKGFVPVEIPIAFKDRKFGKTKMGGGIINEAAITVIRLKLLKKQF